MMRRFLWRLWSVCWGDLLLILLMYLLMAVLAGSVGGCSATEKIAKSVAQVQADATDIRSEVVGARQSLRADDKPGVEKHLDNIDGKADSIQRTTAIIQEEITKVQDRTPYWLSTLKWGIAAVVLLAVIFIMWRLYLFEIIGRLFQGLVTKSHGWLGKVMGA